MLNTEYMLYMVEVSLGFQCWLFIFCLRTWLLISCKNWSSELINFKYRIQLINLNWYIYIYIYIYILCIIKRAGQVVEGWQCFNPLSNPIYVYPIQPKSPILMTRIGGQIGYGWDKLASQADILRIPMWKHPHIS